MAEDERTNIPEFTVTDISRYIKRTLESEFSIVRIKGEIGFSVIRGGNVVGEHSVKYFNGDERLEINHIANDRSIFAKGAIRSAIWASKIKPGFFNLEDVVA